MRQNLIPILVALASLVSAAAAFAQDEAHGSHAGHQHGPAGFEAGVPAAETQASRTIEVVAREGDGRMIFEPAQIHVKKGETIALVIHNEGQLEHEFVLGSARENAAHAAMMQAMPDMADDDPNGVRIAPGHTVKLVWRFSKPGKFEFACLIPGHYDAGMRGTAVVE